MAQSDPLTARGDHATASAKHDWKGVLTALAILVLLGAAAGVVAILFFDVSPTKVLALVAFVTIAIALGVLSAYFKIVDLGISKFFDLWLRFLLWAFVTLIPLAVFRFVSVYILANFSLPFQILAFVAWGLLLAYALLLIATESSRDRLFGMLQAIGGLAPVIYSINVLMVAVIFFSSVTYVLASHGLLTLTSRTGRPVALESLLDFYVWHFFEGVPLLKVNQTLRWDEPWTYESAAVGWILLLFKLVVIVPVIGAFLGYWNRRTAPPRS
jgi:hypothetical protein